MKNVKETELEIDNNMKCSLDQVKQYIDNIHKQIEFEHDEQNNKLNDIIV